MFNDDNTTDTGPAHYQTFGYGVIGMAVIGAVLYFLTLFGYVPTGFIDATGILAITIVFAIVGSTMVSMTGDDGGKG